MIQKDCRHFSGYKPCGKNEICSDACPKKELVQNRILIIHLEALGAVLRSTALLAPIRRKYPKAHITWLTQKPADQLLLNNTLIDRVLTVDAGSIEVLKALEFEAVFCIDKSLQAAGIAAHIKAKDFFGFGLDARSGAILPRSQAAHELWEIGLNDKKKFFENEKPETQLICEALELGPFQRDPYELQLTVPEQIEVARRNGEWLSGKKWILGVNTGCSSVIPYKKLTVDYHRRLISDLEESCQVVLLGGREDRERNQAIGLDLDVIQSPTDQGLRDGILSVAACDVVVTGDSLGMHMAIALGKPTVTWFGPTCAQEIDLYNRGFKVQTRAPCAPCWKRSCQKSVMCYDLVERRELLQGIRKCKERFIEGTPHADSHLTDGVHW